MLSTFIIWNINKAGGARNYTELCAYEKSANGSVSSIIETHDIESITAAVYNETDVDLLFKQIVRVIS